MLPEERAGHPTFWQVFGTGDRPALAIHCSLASSNAWAGVADRLGHRLTLTAFDLPGHGRSGQWQGEGDYLRETVRIAASFVDRPVDLIGHSFGAVAALRLALAAPEAVRTLTLIEPVLFAAARGTAAWEENAALMDRCRAAFTRGDREAAAEAFTGVWGTGAAWADLAGRDRAAITERIHLIEAGTPALFDDSGAILAPGGLESLDLPVLIVRGDRSPAIIEGIAEAIAVRLPDVGVATVPGAGHMVPITHPAETAGLIGVNLDRG
ncbi:alpha/beta fold hydrolase [Albidovulum sp.]|jgi:pimeloyl-ACP methyl ester carboxylesterase|uniref:alpha/beta fold hydrolase n=1 Tax=Albidovulum sp. TaxID=1872424 RepID=UPI0039B878F0